MAKKKSEESCCDNACSLKPGESREHFTLSVAGGIHFTQVCCGDTMYVVDKPGTYTATCKNCGTKHEATLR